MALWNPAIVLGHPFYIDDTSKHVLYAPGALVFIFVGIPMHVFKY